MRKTITVVELLNEANRVLALDTISQDEKWGVIAGIEFALHATGTYAGYNYNGGYVPNVTDETARHYYRSGKLA